MRYLLFSFLFIFSLKAQQKISNQEIWQGVFRENHIRQYQNYNNTSYSQIDYNRFSNSFSINIIDYADQSATKTLLNTQNITGLDEIDDYKFSPDQRFVLVAYELQSIYRYSFRAKYGIYDTLDQSWTVVSDKAIRVPKFSPDSKKIAFEQNNNLFVYDLKTKKTKQITFDGKNNHIINGHADWVYEEEFELVRAFDWSADSKQLAYLKFDESQVKQYNLNVTGNGNYPSIYKFKYPKAGERNASVSLHIYNLTADLTKKVSLSNYEYLPRIKWSNNASELTCISLNRHQNHLKLYQINSNTLKTKILLEEKDKAYVELNNNLTFLKDNSFLWSSEKSNFNHLYHYSASGSLIKQITSGDWDVTSFYGYDAKNKKIYYQSTEKGSTQRHLYQINLNGKSKQIIADKWGTYDADFSKGFKYAIVNFSNWNTPTNYTLFDLKQLKPVKEILNNSALKNKLSLYRFSDKIFTELETSHGTFNMWMLRPKNFDPQKKYPLLMVQYSGPGSQSVSNSWNSYNDYWYQLLAQKGIVVACVDGRGTGYKGADFKKSTYQNLGKLETEDQIEAAKILSTLSYIDPDKTGIWGWSYGGFMAANCLFKGNDVFELGISVAPVSTWRLYDSVYTERFMRTPEENESGYDDNAPLNYANLLKGKYLLVHGTGDDNVHIEHAYQLANTLISNNKDFEMAIYPDRSHGIYEGRNTRIHLFEKMTNFIARHFLGE